ncbi:MAG: helix-turn-helix transcriptional regulator [Burkholderiaceae bacterium]|nr:helix-turn-helix transcriptional regulator [Roseateles sp.]MBV8470092.1 helix-turn-helix transcriptional regulator [Burkholderiaceae bacterium]
MWNHHAAPDSMPPGVPYGQGANANLNTNPLADRYPFLPHAFDKERRRADSLSAHWLSLILEELDYGVLLVNSFGTLMHSNLAARRTMDEQYPVQIHDGMLRPVHEADQVPFFEALQRAETEGRRCLLRLGEGTHRRNVVVVPLNNQVNQAAVLLVLERRQLCADLAAQWFALRYGLTPTETEVLKSLSDGARPAEVAKLQGVAISTVRTQIQSIRSKSGAQSIGELMRQLAVLPPLMSALRMDVR